VTILRSTRAIAHPTRAVTLFRQHRVFFIVIAFAAVLFSSDIWIFKEFVRAESYFALGSRLMIEQGSWLTPHAPDELPLNKPPLTYWLIGVSYRLFGVNYGSARLPSVLAALLILGIVYGLSMRFNGKRAGLISVAMLASSLLFVSFARMAMSDMLLTLCVTASLASFIFTLNEPGGPSKGFVLLGYASLALGVLTKGPIAVVLVAAPISLEMLFRRNRADLKKLRPVPGSFLFLLIAAPYFLIVYATAGAGPLRFFFLGENLQRFTGEVYGASGRRVWYEWVAFFSDFAPWSILVFVALWFNWRGRADNANPARLVHLWFVVTIVLFSLSSFKLDYYLLPAMPAAALIIAPVIANAEALPRFAQRLVKATLVLCAVILVAVAALSVKAAAALSTVTPLRFLPFAFALTGLVVLIVYLRSRQIWQSSFVLSAAIWVTFSAIQWVLLPAFVRYLPAPRLAAAKPFGSALYTSHSASDWANDIAFNLPPPHRVERLTGDTENKGLLAALESDSKSIAVVRESEYAKLLEQDSSLKIIAQAETFGHGGLSLNVIRNPKRERLLLIGHEW
jgi:4-amino-4-deoxy-L-arabinose transferase-like glycosyltransferase